MRKDIEIALAKLQKASEEYQKNKGELADIDADRSAKQKEVETLDKKLKSLEKKLKARRIEHVELEKQRRKAKDDFTLLELKKKRLGNILSRMGAEVQQIQDSAGKGLCNRFSLRNSCRFLSSHGSS